MVTTRDQFRCQCGFFCKNLRRVTDFFRVVVIIIKKIIKILHPNSENYEIVPTARILRHVHKYTNGKRIEN